MSQIEAQVGGSGKERSRNSVWLEPRVQEGKQRKLRLEREAGSGTDNGSLSLCKDFRYPLAYPIQLLCIRVG